MRTLGGMADDTMPPQVPTPEAALAALEADRAARVRRATDAVQAALDASNCILAVWVDVSIGPDGVTRHTPGLEVRAKS